MRHRLTLEAVALEAVDAELALVAPGAPALALAPPDIRARLVELVADGAATPRQAAEALALALELSRAEETGELDEPLGLSLMRQLGERHGASRGPN